MDKIPQCSPTMNYTKLGTFAKTSGITAVAKTVRINTNGYPFLTMLRGNDAENLYFSKSAAALVTEGTVTASIAKELFVVDAKNAAGETRTKLTFNNSNYADIDDLFE